MRRLKRPSLRSVGILASVALLVWATVAIASLVHSQSGSEHIAAACGSPNPYLVTTRFAVQDEPTDLPAVVAFRDTLGRDSGDSIVLATQSQVGAVYGLAYDAGRRWLYAAAYHRRRSGFGPGGPGAIYRIDLMTGSVAEWHVLDAGPDWHDFSDPTDRLAGTRVGRVSLGDIELTDDGDALFAANLFDGRIYVLSTLESRVVTSFANGAVGDADVHHRRLLGLGYNDGWLYHAVTDVDYRARRNDKATGHIYRSRADGSDMREVASFSMPVERYSLRMPVVADIEFRPGGDLIIGVRETRMDDVGKEWGIWRYGDIFPARRQGDRWSVATEPEHYDDQLRSGAAGGSGTVGDEAVMGGLAALPGLDLVAASAMGLDYVTARNPSVPNISAFALWLDNATGQQERQEVLFGHDRAAQERGARVGIGDVEVLCGRRRQLEPAKVATATSAAARTATVLVPTGTPTSMPVGTPVDLPALVAGSCAGDNPFAAVVCYLGSYYRYPARSSAGPWTVGVPAVIAFRDTAADNPQYTLARLGSVGSVWGLGYDHVANALYVAAFHKRGLPFGPGGPGAIYRIDLGSLSVSTFATVPNAGRSQHDLRPVGQPFDQRARDWAGKTSLGDLDVSAEERMLFVTNLADGRIYRFDLDTGRLLGSFAHGAVAEPWAKGARPFGLKYRAGRVYHGVVNSAESSGNRADLRGYIYSSAVDGSEMRLELEVPLDYDRGVADLPGVLGAARQKVPLDWLPWAEGYNDLADKRASLALYPQPIVSDIEFTARGHMAIGLRDRQTDMTLSYQSGTVGYVIAKPGAGVGDLLLARYTAGGWARPDERFFAGLADGVADRSGMGGLAIHLPFNLLLADRIDLGVLFFGTAPPQEVLWFDAAGNPRRSEYVCGWYAAASVGGERRVRGVASLAASLLQDDEFYIAAGMGDVEVLCRPQLPTSTPAPTWTARPTATATAVPTAPPTPTPAPAYLPIALKEHCQPVRERADVALVIDTSSSMRGRKLADAKASASLFVGLLDLSAAGDRVAVVRFDTTAELVHQLSADRASVTAAIAALASRRGTYIDRGLREALAEVTGVRHKAANRPVIVLLTDGIQTGVPGAELWAAEEVRRTGVRLYGIGLGRDVDEETLVKMVGDRRRYYFAPDSSDLAAIYSQVARDITCPADQFWGRRP